ncbi:LLM class F420-dependent oxidoreductase [Amycolatopsis balhimycina DSM 5908]|uniref:LLM class F420-dependent oxidoreductase n=1 Tax=Amycolatopsis balhimycina DSM 5908 TaxID=1081091 RepID=A0A428WQW2_AMYBA|nr:LLM class F420-dependent oxidoreductase [Amycolatopsis balhimycina]RSM45475.1 LLM class F420-dependent oxidoreductase [Amycolatopsis balhimycina DSM 5908]
MTGDFRFGVNMVVPDSRSAWVEKCRKAEDLGYDVLSAADHLGMAPPFPALVLAGEVTSRVKLNTFVLNAPFYNPVLLARDVTGTDQFTDGRLELGLGAGYVKEEFEAAGMPFPSARERVDHLERMITELKRLYADPEHKPAPVRPEGPPLLLGGRGDRVLGLAAEHADIIGFTGTTKTPDGAPLAAAGPEEIDERVAFVRAKLGDREAHVEFNLLCQFVKVTDDRAAGLAEVEQLVGGRLGAEAIGELPVVLVGTAAQIADQLRAHRERFGFSYFTILEPFLDEFAPVLEHLR